MREERRKSRRFPVLGEHQKATLRVGDVTIPVRLVDQSATGFAIRVEEHPGVFPGEIVWLQTVAGWTEVRVVKARHDAEGTQVGLERIADLATGPTERGSVLSEQLAQENPHQNPWPLLGLIVALSALLVFLGWRAVENRMLRVETVMPVRSSEPPDPRPAAVRALEHETARRASELHKSIQQLTATMLALPDVAEHLKLSPQQRQRLQEIVQAAKQEEQRLKQSASSGDARDLEAKIQSVREAASHEAVNLLDAQQRQQWVEMFQAAVKHLHQPESKKTAP